MSARSRRSGRVLLTTSGVTPVIAAIITLGAAIITRGIIAGWVVLLATGLLIAGVVWLVLWRLRGGGGGGLGGGLGPSVFLGGRGVRRGGAPRG
ncbi:hypothetical protein, partial [Cutibacterium acnes]|uniref:hypothetical protein n=1 Tax=Cutibacterium acnes TaxID=1747 RepID=UPI0022771BBD